MRPAVAHGDEEIDDRGLEKALAVLEYPIEEVRPQCCLRREMDVLDLLFGSGDGDRHGHNHPVVWDIRNATVRAGAPIKFPERRNGQQAFDVDAAGIGGEQFQACCARLEPSLSWGFDEARLPHVEFRPVNAVVENGLATAGQQFLAFLAGQAEFRGDLVRDLGDPCLARCRPEASRFSNRESEKRSLSGKEAGISTTYCSEQSAAMARGAGQTEISERSMEGTTRGILTMCRSDWREMEFRSDSCRSP